MMVGSVEASRKMPRAPSSSRTLNMSVLLEVVVPNLFESGNARNPTTQNQVVDIVSPFIGLHAF